MRSKPTPKKGWNDNPDEFIPAAAPAQPTPAQLDRQIAEQTKELNEVVGMSGSLSRVSSGGVQVKTGSGVEATFGGTRKSTIESDGDLFVGSDIDTPEGRSLAVFVNDQTYNDEAMEEGDLLVGDNSTAAANMLYDASEGRLNFRGGTTVQVYIDTDGTLKAASGAIELGTGGIVLVNTSGIITFLKVDGNDGAYIYNLGTDDLAIQVNTPGKGLNIQIIMTNNDAPTLAWKEDSTANKTLLSMAVGAAGGRLAIGADHLLDALNNAGTGSAAVTFNYRDNDIDFIVKDDAGAEAIKVDAGTGTVSIPNLIMASQWEICTETWTRTGNHSFTVSGDVRTKYRKYTKVRYTDGGGAEFGVIADSTYSSPDTTVTLIPNTDYLMAAATIANKYISYSANPEFSPGVLNFDANPQGFAVVPTSATYRWTSIGNRLFIDYVELGNGTSNATTFTASAPVVPINSVTEVAGTLVDNSAVLTTAGRVVMSAGSTNITFRSDMASGAWTNANGKRAVAQWSYRY